MELITPSTIPPLTEVSIRTKCVSLRFNYNFLKKYMMRMSVEVAYIMNGHHRLSSRDNISIGHIKKEHQA